jgi:hypothetical protein
MGKLSKQAAVSNDAEPESALTNTDEAGQGEVITVDHSEGSNEASGLIGADDLVPAINEAAALLIRSEVDGFTESLRHQFALGKLLSKAKDALEHGKWTTWFEPEDQPRKFPFSMRKAQRCMRFAEYEPELLEWAEENRQQLADLAGEGQLGVEDAENFIKELKEKRAAEAAAEAEAASNLTVVLGKFDEAASDLGDILGKFDEAKATKIIEKVWDQEKREQFVATQLKAMLGLLRSAPGYYQLANLIEQLSTHLKSHST